MPLVAHQDCIIVKQDDEQLSKTIIIPNAGKGNTGTVVSAGPKARDIRDGDRIYFDGTEFGCQPFEHEGAKYVVLREKHVWGLIDG